MKKKIICLLLLAALLLLLSAGALAARTRVIDEAGLLTESEKEKLEEKIKEIYDEYDFELAILTVEGMGGKSAEAFADDYYDDHGYGYGMDHDGALVLVDMGERDLYISTGGKGQWVFTDNDIDAVLDDMADYLSSGNYYRSFAVFVSDSEKLLEEYDGGQTVRNSGSNPAKKLIPAAIISFLISLLVVAGMKRKMNTAVKNQNARDYVRPGSFVLTRERDTYLYSNVTMVRRQTNDSNRGGGHGGGSSTHFSSSGVSHGGGGRKF